MSERPQRAVRMTLTIGADTRKDMVAAIDHLCHMIETDQIHGPSGCSGGCHSGYSYEFTASDRPTHDEYMAALDAHLAAGKAAGARE